MDKWLGKVMTIVSETGWGSYRMKEDNGKWSWWGGSIAGIAEDFEEKIVIKHNKKDTIARYYKDGKCVRKAAAHCHKDDEFDFKRGAEIAFNRLIAGIPSLYRFEELVPKKYVDDKANTPVPKFQIGDRVEYHDNHTFDALLPKLTDGEAGTILSIRVVSDWILYQVKFDDSYNPAGVWVNETLLTKRPKYYTAKIVCVDNHHLPHWQVGKIYHVTDGRLEGDDQNIRYWTLEGINGTHSAKFIEVVD